ncbi:uncharacterized protein LOC130724823 [Lotus japonicus]|uniref:uncharacterized protein LOC130724823 n=1 Tax=Lotus japonicus TaxID=34305 RepID=UPI00258CB424|nr:uncharacterized protein LOC130724823 [Lotus japonicus]
METLASNPPDGGGGMPNVAQPREEATRPSRPSFRDKLMGGAKAADPKERVDLFKQGKMKVEFLYEAKRLPRIVVDKSVIEDMCAPWKEALVVCLLGKRLGFRVMKSKLAYTWRLSGDFELLDVGNGFFMVKFDMEEDRNKVIGGGPWMIFDHYLAVATWSPEFISPAARVKKTLAWIRIPGLNVAFYDESFLMSVAQVIGKPVRVDMNTLRGDRGRFARICVELDLTKPVYGKIMIEDFWYNIEYEGLHIICTKCGCYGHRSRECTTPVVMEETVGVQTMESEQTEGGIAGVAHPGNAVREGMETSTTDIRKDIETVNLAVMGTPEIVESSNGDSMDSMNPKESGPTQKKSELKLKPPEEIFGEWMVVSRKKKKQPKQLPQKGGSKDSMGKAINAHHGQQKAKPNHAAMKINEKKSAPPTFQPKSVEGLKFGMGSGPQSEPTVDNKKRRARGDEWEKVVQDMRRKEIKMGPTSASKFVFGDASGNDKKVKDQSVSANDGVDVSNKDAPGSSRSAGIQINES